MNGIRVEVLVRSAVRLVKLRSLILAFSVIGVYSRSSLAHRSVVLRSVRRHIQLPLHVTLLIVISLNAVKWV